MPTVKDETTELDEDRGVTRGIFGQPIQPNVHQLITKVKESIGSVGKGKRMTEGPAKYAYRSVDDILDAAHAGLIRYGVFWVPNLETAEWSEFSTKSGARGVRVVATISYEIFGPAGDSFSARVIGEAQDYSDKAANKAFTAAEKILVSQLFAIPFAAEDPDDTRIERSAMTPDHVRSLSGQNGAAPARELVWPDDYADDTPLRSTGQAKSTLLGLVGNDKTEAAELWKSVTDPDALTLGDLRSLAKIDLSIIPSATGRPAPSSPPPSAAPAPGPTPATKTQRDALNAAFRELPEDKQRQVLQWCEANHHDVKNLVAASYAPVMQAIDNTARVQPSPKPARSGLAPAASVMDDKRKREQLRAELVGRLELLGQEFIDAALKAIKDAGGPEGSDLAEVVRTAWADSADGDKWLSEMVGALEEEAGKPYEEPASEMADVDYVVPAAEWWPEVGLGRAPWM